MRIRNAIPAKPASPAEMPVSLFAAGRAFDADGPLSGGSEHGPINRLAVVTLEKLPAALAMAGHDNAQRQRAKWGLGAGNSLPGSGSVQLHGSEARRPGKPLNSEKSYGRRVR
jgi:hypothetical protein